MLASEVVGPEFIGDGLHQARLAAPTDPGEHLDHAVVVAETSDLLEVLLPFEQTHAGPNLSTEANMTNALCIGVCNRAGVLYPCNYQISNSHSAT